MQLTPNMQPDHGLNLELPKFLPEVIMNLAHIAAT
jgi:hypothetical protein